MTARQGSQLQRYRRIALACQGLASAKPFGQGLTGTLRAIEHLGYVQIDTLAVVQRAHHHCAVVAGAGLRHRTPEPAGAGPPDL